VTRHRLKIPENNLEVHHVWIELAAKCCSKNTSVVHRVLLLTACSTDERRTADIGRATNKARSALGRRNRVYEPIYSSFLETETYLSNLWWIWMVSTGVANLSLGPRSGDVYAVSLVTDHEDRPLLALCV